jgi:competence protein ComEC
MFVLINDIIGGDEGGFAAAMLCGDKTELSKQTKLTVYRSGIGHIFSVSGTHVVIISAMIGWLMQKLSKDKRVIFAVQTVAMWAFAVFAGFSVSVVRAAVMLTLVTAAPLLYRRPDPANTLCLCAVVILTLSPYAAADSSFLLSFTAAFVISVVCPKAVTMVKRRDILGNIEREIVTAVTILLCTMPVQLMFFSEISLVAPLSNILLVPVCTLALGLTVITAVTGGAAIVAYPVLTVVKYLLKVVLFLAELFSKFSFAYLPRGVRPLGIVMLVTCLVPVAVMFLRKSVKLGAFCTALMLVCWTAVYNFSLAFGGSVKIVVMPKGNAVQAVLYDKTKGMVFDMGSKGKLNSGMESFLELYGIKELKGAFIESEQYYTITKYNEQMTIRPDRFYINGEPDNDSELPFMTGAQLDWNGVKIEALEDGYKITTEGCVVTIEKGSVTINGRNLDTTDEEYPLMIDMKNSQIRRTDYGFAYGFGSW